MKNYIQLLPWDSNFFHCKIGKISGQIRSAAFLQKTLVEARRAGYRCIYFENEHKSDEVDFFCSQNGFICVDLKTTLSKSLRRSSIVHSESNAILPAQKKDLPLLKAIARDVICRKSRFWTDPHFGPVVCKRLYEKWTEVSLLKDYCNAFFVYLLKGRPIGFITVKEKKNQFYVNLFGVHSKFHGKGIGLQLLQKAECWTFAQGKRKLCVVTQGRNFQALCVYKQFGFHTDSEIRFYHKWF